MLYPKPLFDVQIDLTLFNLLLLRLRLLTLLCASIWLFIAISMSKFHFPLAIEHVSARWAWNISHPLQMGKLIFYSDRILVFYFDETFFCVNFFLFIFGVRLYRRITFLTGLKAFLVKFGRFFETLFAAQIISSNFGWILQLELA